jgi:hypothetical protein
VENLLFSDEKLPVKISIHLIRLLKYFDVKHKIFYQVTRRQFFKCNAKNRIFQSAILFLRANSLQVKYRDRILNRESRLKRRIDPGQERVISTRWAPCLQRRRP